MARDPGAAAAATPGPEVEAIRGTGGPGAPVGARSCWVGGGGGRRRGPRETRSPPAGAAAPTESPVLKPGRGPRPVACRARPSLVLGPRSTPLAPPPTGGRPTPGLPGWFERGQKPLTRHRECPPRPPSRGLESRSGVTGVRGGPPAGAETGGPKRGCEVSGSIGVGPAPPRSRALTGPQSPVARQTEPRTRLGNRPPVAPTPRRTSRHLPRFRAPDEGDGRAKMR